MKPLIDGDVLLYEVGFACEYGKEEIPSFEYVKEVMDGRINDICEAVQASSQPTLYLTGTGNFREKIAKRKEYKGNRNKEKPFHYENLKAYLKACYDAVVVDGMEADDAMAIAQMSNAKEHGVGFPISGGTCIVDYEDYHRINEVTWHLSKKGYVVNDTGKGGTRNVRQLHQEILGDCPPGFVIDHINGNTLDNRKCNLRFATIQQNIWNSKPQKGSSKYKGVSFDLARDKWSASIKVNGKTVSLGRFDIEEEAALEYDHAALKYYGDFARTNILPPPVQVPEFLQTIICTRDKDLRMVPFQHYGWESGKQGEYGPVFVDELGELYEAPKKIQGTGLRFFYYQLLIGDSVDNIPGCPGIGPKTAIKLLRDAESEGELYDVVLAQYEEKFPENALEELLEQAHLLWMVREVDDEGKPIMWEQPE